VGAAVAERRDLGRAQAVSPCPICERGEPLGLLAQRPTTWITTEREPAAPGYLCVVAKRHVVEPFELAADERGAFWDDILFAAERVANLLEPPKLHYEIHGSTIAHLHAHVIPRYDDVKPTHDVERLREALR
jgi:diadenosine tetraphosphate (Ap4A) HIT family hydrolase